MRTCEEIPSSAAVYRLAQVPQLLHPHRRLESPAHSSEQHVSMHRETNTDDLEKEVADLECQLRNARARLNSVSELQDGTSVLSTPSSGTTSFPTVIYI